MPKSNRKSKKQAKDLNLTEREKQFLELLADIYVESVLKQSGKLSNLQKLKNQDIGI